MKILVDKLKISWTDDDKTVRILYCSNPLKSITNLGQAIYLSFKKYPIKEPSKHYPYDLINFEINLTNWLLVLFLYVKICYIIIFLANFHRHSKAQPGAMKWALLTYILQIWINNSHLHGLEQAQSPQYVEFWVPKGHLIRRSPPSHHLPFIL